jgi:hypothetical protein
VNCFIAIIVALGVGIGLTSIAFVWINRNKPTALDAVEGAMRKDPSK